MRNFLLSICITILTTASINAQTAVFKGIVFDAISKDSLQFVSITLFRNDTILAKTTTDSHGKFAIKNLPTGKYDSKAEIAGYAVLSVNRITFKDNETSIVYYNLLTTLDDSLAKVKGKELGFVLVCDSLGNSWCFDSSKNKKDSLGRKQGLWVERFMDYSHKRTKFKIGQVICEGSYRDNYKIGNWTYYTPNREFREVERIDVYENGKLIKPNK